MSDQEQLVADFANLNVDEQNKVRAAIAPLAQPSTKANDIIWIIVVSAFALVFVVGLVLVYLLSTDDKSTDFILPLVTGVFGALSGLLAPSPATK